MKLMESIDDKFKKIGFEKVKEDKYGSVYERPSEYGYVQVINILHKQSGRHLIQSYQKDLNKDGFNNMVGLTATETKLALKKMKRMR